jgi:hypothetical protein
MRPKGKAPDRSSWSADNSENFFQIPSHVRRIHPKDSNAIPPAPHLPRLAVGADASIDRG